MATVTTKHCFSFVIFLFVFLVLQPSIGDARKLLLNPVDNDDGCKFDRIFNLGDSISDTGNLVTESPYGSGILFNRLPYGETLGKPTGRCSNGLLMIDYFAKEFGLPYLNPSEKVDESTNFTQGINFAVAGATALPVESLISKNVSLRYLPTNSSLGVQLQSLSSHLNNTTCQNKNKTECRELLKNSLFFVGEIGGNDYNYALIANQTMDQLTALVPEVVQSIYDAVKGVINLGATKIIVPGNFPIGCLPIYLSSFPVNDSSAYDSRQCLAGLNTFAIQHNNILEAALQQLRETYPEATIVYASYYDAFELLLYKAQEFGFVEKFSACCGSGGEHNFSLGRLCGMPGVSACSNPDNHISWDGIHMTQQAYKFMAEYLTIMISAQLKCNGRFY